MVFFPRSQALILAADGTAGPPLFAGQIPVVHCGHPHCHRCYHWLLFHSQLLIVTCFLLDVASRGLDIPLVDAVVNFNVPLAVEDYIHR